MGAYLNKPVTEKHSESGSNEFLIFNVSSMQGWRLNQEDAHSCLLDFDSDQGASLFAVYDGHGGSEVARYCARKLPDFLHTLPAFTQRDKDPVNFLKTLFLDFDASLIKQEVQAEMRTLKDKKPIAPFTNRRFRRRPENEEEEVEDDDADEDEEERREEITALHAEADEPLESVLERYGDPSSLPEHLKLLLKYRQMSEFINRNSDEKFSTSSSSAASSVSTPVSNTDKEDDKNPLKSEKDSNEPSTGDNQSSTVATGSSDVASSSLSSSSETPSGPSGDSNAIPVDGTSTSNSITQALLQDEGDCEEEEEDSDYDVNAAAEGSSESDEVEEEDSDEEDSEEDEDSDDDDETLEVPQFAFQDGGDPGVDSGCTACLAYLLPCRDGVVRLYVANAGDSRAVLCRGGKAIDLSIDHKPEDDEEKNRITLAGGEVTADGRVNGGLNLSRALGDHSYKVAQGLPLSQQMITPLPDVTCYELQPDVDDFLVVACDGIWNSLTSQEVVDFVHSRLYPVSEPEEEGTPTPPKSPPPAVVVDPYADCPPDHVLVRKTCDQLLEACLAPDSHGDGTGCDNMTCIIIQFKDLVNLARHTVDKSAELAGSAVKRPLVEHDSNQVTDATTPESSNGTKDAESEVPPHKRPRVDEEVAESTANSVTNGEAKS